MPVYYAGIDPAEFSAGMSVAVSGLAGTGTATIASTTRTAGGIAMGTISTPPVSSGFLPFADGVTEALASVNANFTCDWSEATLAYTISCNTSFTLTFTGTAGTNLSRALGIVDGSSSGDAMTSTVRPWYVISSEIDARSDVTNVYEADDNVIEAVADGGAAYGVSRDTAELRSDWVQSMEPLAAVFSRSATAAVPWTWEHFVKHLRGALPFAVVDNGTTTVHQLRAEGGSFSQSVRERVVRDWDGLWNIRLMTRDLGTL